MIDVTEKIKAGRARISKHSLAPANTSSQQPQDQLRRHVAAKLGMSLG
jgi:hypothetical protein